MNRNPNLEIVDLPNQPAQAADQDDFSESESAFNSAHATAEGMAALLLDASTSKEINVSRTQMNSVASSMLDSVRVMNQEFQYIFEALITRKSVRLNGDQVENDYPAHFTDRQKAAMDNIARLVKKAQAKPAIEHLKEDPEFINLIVVLYEATWRAESTIRELKRTILASEDRTEHEYVQNAMLEVGRRSISVSMQALDDLSEKVGFESCWPDNANEIYENYPTKKSI